MWRDGSSPYNGKANRKIKFPISLSGAEAGSGTYIYRLEFKNKNGKVLFSKNRRMIMAK
jgi:hypothetical protein